MNKIEQQKTQICTNPVKRQWRKTMKNTLPTMMLSAAIAAASFSLPTHAAVIDQVKNKVDAIKNETSTIKNKVNAVQDHLNEVGLTVNAQIAESIDIQEKLAPLKAMQDKFSGAGVDPAELLDLVPAEDIQRMIAQLKAKKQEAQDRLQDPNLESFRQEFLAILEGINEIVIKGDTAVEMTPFQSLVEKAPLPIIALLKALTQDIIPDLKRNISNAVVGIRGLRDAGAFELANDLDSLVVGLESMDQDSMTVVANSQRWDAQVIHSAYYRDASSASLRQVSNTCVGLRQRRNALLVTEFALNNIKNYVDIMENKIDEDTGKINAGVHGYFFFNVKPSKPFKQKLSESSKLLELLNLEIGFLREVNGLMLDADAC